MRPQYEPEILSEDSGRRWCKVNLLGSDTENFVRKTEEYDRQTYPLKKAQLRRGFTGKEEGYYKGKVYREYKLILENNQKMRRGRLL